MHFPFFSCRIRMYLTNSHTHFPIKKCLQAVCYLCSPSIPFPLSVALHSFSPCVLCPLNSSLFKCYYMQVLPVSHNFHLTTSLFALLTIPLPPPYALLLTLSTLFHCWIIKKCVKYEKHLCKLQRVQLLHKKFRKMLENTFCTFLYLHSSCFESNECVPMNKHEYLCRVTVQQTF